MNNFAFTFFLTLISSVGFCQDTVYCCTPIDTYVAAQCDLIFKDSLCYKDKKEFTGVLVVNCIGDSKSRRNNGVYNYNNGRITSSHKLTKHQKLQKGIPVMIASSSVRKFSGGMRRQFGGDHNETYQFTVNINAPVRIDSVIHLNKVYKPADSIAKLASNIKFTVLNAFHGSNGQYTTAAIIEHEGTKYSLTEYYVREYQAEALRIYYTVNGVQRYAIKKEYDSVEHNAAP